MNTPVLSVLALSKSFGAITACKQVDLNLYKGEIHALIGPNGAGKSTLIAQVCGSLPPDSGQILLEGRDVTALNVVERSRLGIARTFQVSALAMEDSVLENVMVAVLGASGRAFSWFKSARKEQDVIARAKQALETVGLAGYEDYITAEISHGQRRQLEMAIAISLKPVAFILDEPMAGLGAQGSSSLTQLLAELKKEAPILLVEHDMDAVFALADRISVLNYGEIVASGTVEEIRANAVVKEAYLGSIA